MDIMQYRLIKSEQILFFTTGVQRRSITHHNDEADVQSEMELLR